MRARVPSLTLSTLAALERRLPALTRLRGAERLPVRLGMRRIYVLPTAYGLFFGMVLLAMLLAALNYDNASALILCLFAAALVHNALFATFRNLHGLSVASVRAPPVFAGEPLVLRVEIAETAGRSRNALRIRRGALETVFAVPGGGRREVELPIPTHRRGLLPIGTLRLATSAPYGLFVAWSHLHPEQALLVYPRPETDGPPLPLAGREGGTPRAELGGEEPQGVREWRRGDPMRLVAWRMSARAGRLLSKELARADAGEVELRYETLAGLGHEERIARLTRWVLLAEREGRRYALSIPGARIPAGHGPQHLDHCLSALARLPEA